MAKKVEESPPQRIFVASPETQEQAKSYGEELAAKHPELVAAMKSLGAKLNRNPPVHAPDAKDAEADQNQSYAIPPLGVAQKVVRREYYGPDWQRQAWTNGPQTPLEQLHGQVQSLQDAKNKVQQDKETEDLRRRMAEQGLRTPTDMEL